MNLTASETLQPNVLSMIGGLPNVEFSTIKPGEQATIYLRLQEYGGQLTYEVYFPDRIHKGSTPYFVAGQFGRTVSIKIDANEVVSLNVTG